MSEENKPLGDVTVYHGPDRYFEEHLKREVMDDGKDPCTGEIGKVGGVRVMAEEKKPLAGAMRAAVLILGGVGGDPDPVKAQMNWTRLIERESGLRELVEATRHAALVIRSECKCFSSGPMAGLICGYCVEATGLETALKRVVERG